VSDRRSRLSRLEGRVRISAQRLSDELEDYFAALENYQREKDGLPLLHHIDDKRGDDELEAYFRELEEQEIGRLLP
jgi:hypothetical protein